MESIPEDNFHKPILRLTDATFFDIDQIRWDLSMHRLRSLEKILSEVVRSLKSSLNI